MFSRKRAWFFAFFAVWAFVIFSQNNVEALLQEYGFFTFVGIVGAVFANATGAGGGVIFVPFFAYLSFTPDSIVATSFAIQCCGMTAGAITWTRFFCSQRKTDQRKTDQRKTDSQWDALPSALLLTVIPSICGVLFSQYTAHGSALLLNVLGGPENLHTVFGVFSVILAIAIIGSIPLMKRQVFSNALAGNDIVCLPTIAFLGGCITAWLSIGVGELVAVYLIIRGFNVTMSIAVAVILSAFTVWSAVPFHVLVSHAIVYDVVIFAGAGAILGGVMAKYLVLAFSTQSLKLFFGLWVFLLGVTSLPIF
ncbi:sulfite exporter TauE/SafE family protein [Alteromonas sp. A081]|uniref:sulfite exporter TauE/SafE family protein n=1 Tax=Alteromonas sp. A081 TaxID=3410269 RepID=UPI003B97E121